MVTPDPESYSTVAELFQTIQEIDQSLNRFQRELLPQMKHFGMDLSGWVLNFGDRYRQASQNLYTQVQQRTLKSGGNYLYTDLVDLEKARQMAERAETIKRAGQTVGRLVDMTIFSVKIFQQASAHAAIMVLLLDMQKRLPILRERAARSEAYIHRFLEKDDRIFRLLAVRCSAIPAEHRANDRIFVKLIESYRRLYEGIARLRYYHAVFDVVARFEPPKFAQTMRDLQEKGLGDHQLYLLEGNLYLKHLDDLIDQLDWNDPYYLSGLPEGLRFFLAYRRRQLPPGSQLRSLDNASARIRQETPGMFHPAALIRAVNYLSEQLGSPFFFLDIRLGNVYKIVLGIALLVAGAVLILTGVSDAFFNELGFLIKAAWTSFTTAIPVNNIGQLVALLFIGLIMLLPLVWMVFLFSKKPRS